MNAKTPIRLLDLFRYYRGLPHQQAALEELAELIPKELLGRDQPWFHTWSQAGKQSDIANTWDRVLAAAEAAGAKFPELVAAQWALESGWGKHTSGKHNYFGLKGSGTATETQEFINGQWLTITADFIDFPDLQSCVSYLVNHWYEDYRHYKGCNRAKTAEDAARWLVQESYATAPDYSDRLIAIMAQQARNARAKAKEPEAPLPARLTPRAAFTLHLTPHIRLGEFALDQQERRFQHQHQLDTAAELAAFLERVRRNFGGKPVIITSGYRPPAINKACGGAADSEHLYSEAGEGAVDFYLEGADLQAVQQFCDKYWDFSLGYGAAKGFVHLGRRADGQRRRWDY